MSVEGSHVVLASGHGESGGCEGQLDFGAAEWESSRLITVPVDQVRPDPEQPRKHFDEDTLRELGASLRVIQVQPIVVRRDATGWVLVDGERRWRAARVEGLATLEAREMALTERVTMVSMVIQLAANTHRDQLTLEEQANGVLRIAEGGFPTPAIARVLGHNEDYVVSLLAIARSGDARELIAAGRLASVSGWDAYLALEPAVRKRVLDSTDPVTADRCERVRREHELAERAKQLRLAMPRSPAPPAPPVTAGAAAPAGAPAGAPSDEGTGGDGDGEGGAAASGVTHSAGSEPGDESGLASHPASDGASGEGAGDSRPTGGLERGIESAAVPPTGEDDRPLRTFAEALDAYHLEAHDERDALIAGLDGVREGLDTLLTTMGGSAEITDPVFEVLRGALAPVQRVLDAALKKIVRPPEFPPCCVLNAAAHHAERAAREGERS